MPRRWRNAAVGAADFPVQSYSRCYRRLQVHSARLRPRREELVSKIYWYLFCFYDLTRRSTTCLCAYFGPGCWSVSWVFFNSSECCQCFWSCVSARHVAQLLRPWQLVNKHRPVNSCWWCNVELLLTFFLLPPHHASLNFPTAPPLLPCLFLFTSFTGCCCRLPAQSVWLPSSLPCPPPPQWNTSRGIYNRHVFSCHQRRVHIITLSSQPKYFRVSGSVCRAVEWRGTGWCWVSLNSCLFVCWHYRNLDFFSSSCIVWSEQ